jgi:hypothetical protein
MKTTTLLLLSLISIQLYACSKGAMMQPVNNATMDVNMDTMKLKITVGSRVFTATLHDNATARALKVKLPMTIHMTELNGNEKYFDLPFNLPTNASSPGTIQTGDLMLYGANILVVFYKTYSTSYSYTPLGRIDNPSGLAAALGSGSVTVSFEAE